jgi:uncharacterized protein
MERNVAYEIIKQNVLENNLIKHCLSVEVGMRKVAEHFKDDVERWGLVGLLHDVDYGTTKDNPQRHGLDSIEILKAYDMDEEILEAIKGHNEILGFPRTTLMAKALFCVDQLTGLIVASTLVLPSKKIKELTLESVLKKFKEKSFAKGAKRENILLCESDLNIPLDDFVNMVLSGMQEIGNDIGL